MEQQTVENKVPKYDYDIRTVSCPKIYSPQRAARDRLRWIRHEP
jgi:hypothetical protein